MDTKSAIQTHRGRELGTLGYPLAIQSLVHVTGPHRSDYGPPPDIPMVAMDFDFANTESDDDVLTILAMNEKPFQSVGATVLPDKSASEFAVATIIGFLDFWGTPRGHDQMRPRAEHEANR